MKDMILLALDGESGKNWYGQARRRIRQVCRTHGWDWRRYTDVLAITSPRVQVTRNVNITRLYMQGDPSWSDGVLRGRVDAVLRWERDGTVRGPKVAPFRDALQGDHSAIVLDVWMARAFEVPDNFGVRHRRLMQDSIKKVSEWLGWTPAQTQAAIWCGIIKKYGRNPQEIKP